MAYVNRAAWQVGKRVLALKVDDAPYTPPGKDQVVIRNGAVGINLFDWWLQYVSAIFAPHLTFPTILGTDCAGTVVEVGSDVTRFKVGDR
jgi:NADPH:quinone reductase-like Zn-dependent oxidoreductase